MRTFSTNKQLVEDRRNLISRRALPLFIKQGFKATTIRDIAKACNMTHPAIYRYVGKKEDVLSLVMQDIYTLTYTFLKEAPEEAAQNNPVEALVRMIDRYYRIHHFGRVTSVFLMSNYMFFMPRHRLQIVEIHNNTIAVFENVLKRGCQSGDFAIDDTWLCAFDIVQTGQIWGQRQHIIANKYTIDQYIEFCTQQIMKQIRPATPVMPNKQL